MSAIHAKKIVFCLFILCFIVLSACTTNPATGRSSFTGLMPLESEKQVGAQGYQEIVSKPNSVYENAKLQSFVNDIGQRLARHSERTDINYTFTVLNADEVNAFAMPGGYIFITRGLLAVANSEAEVAAVLAHEMAHVTARHSAQQYSHSVATGVGASLLGVLTGNDTLGQAANTGGALYLRSYSREHEHEADALGVRYLEAEGYDPFSMANFLSSLLDSTRLQAQLAGANTESVDSFNYLSTHPTTQSRIADVTALAQNTIKQGKPYMNGIDRYMTAIDGTIYGSSEDQGYIRGQDFIHVPMDFRFTVPAGFTLINSEDSVLAKDKAGTIVVFDIKKTDKAVASPVQFIQKLWLDGAKLANTDVMMVDNHSAAIASASVAINGTPKVLWVGAIQKSATEFYRFYMICNDIGTLNAMANPFRATVHSFANLTEREKQTIKPYTLDVVTIGAHNSPRDLANQMRINRLPLEHFMVLNAVDSPDTKLKVGTKVKIIK